MARIHDYFRKLKSAGASDLHLSTGRAPMVRVSGQLVAIPDEERLENEALRELLREVVDEQQWKSFNSSGDFDFAVALEGVGRFRGNYFEQQSGVAAVFRLIPEKVVPIERLGVPPAVNRLADLGSGLVLVTGPTGSGKSTTLASIIDLINRKHKCHVVTIEDPIEFVHQNKRSVISHREVGTDTRSFASALRAAVRQDADVVLVGEMRDLETISLAIEGASMGVLVFGTLHTSGAAKTVDRIVDAFPADQQGQVRNMLADSLAAVVSQVLCRRSKKGRAGAFEILIGSSAVSGAIRECNTSMINSIIGAGRGQGMQSLDEALMALVKEGVVEGREAFLKANDKKLFARFRQAAGSEGE
jgi:twitching motility protein PilT